MSRVFVSHRRVDSNLAEQLANEIRARGHVVWFDEWEIGSGDSIVSKMNSGLEQADFLVLCLTRSSCLAPWIAREWMSSLARSLNGDNVTILPVLLEKAEPPAILADIRYADLTGDWARGVDELARALTP